MGETAMGENEIAKAQENVDSLETLVNQWAGLKEQLESNLNSPAGTTFTGYFTIGKKYSRKILGVTNILQDIEGSIHSLITATNDFLEKQRKANEKEFSNSN